MSDAAAIQGRAMRDFLRWLGGASDGARVWEAPGVLAAIVPATPERSIVNSAVYDDPADLDDAYAALDRAYRDAGIAAWTVWVPEHDGAAIEALTGRGHAFDGKPVAMTLDLEGFAAPGPGDLDWDAEASFAELGRVNDAAYGLAPGEGMSPAMVRAAAGLPMRLYRARRDGETACVLGTIDHGDDLGIYFVATAEGHTRQALAGRLLAAALEEGRERGLRTSSLQSSAKGQRVYERLGYRSHYRFHLYERRR